MRTSPRGPCNSPPRCRRRPYHVASNHSPIGRMRITSCRRPAVVRVPVRADRASQQPPGAWQPRGWSHLIHVGSQRGSKWSAGPKSQGPSSEASGRQGLLVYLKHGAHSASTARAAAGREEPGSVPRWGAGRRQRWADWPAWPRPPPREEGLASVQAAGLRHPRHHTRGRVLVAVAGRRRSPAHHRWRALPRRAGHLAISDGAGCVRLVCTRGTGCTVLSDT